MSDLGVEFARQLETAGKIYADRAKNPEFDATIAAIDKKIALATWYNQNKKEGNNKTEAEIVDKAKELGFKKYDEAAKSSSGYRHDLDVDLLMSEFRIRHGFRYVKTMVHDKSKEEDRRKVWENLAEKTYEVRKKIEKNGYTIRDKDDMAWFMAHNRYEAAAEELVKVRGTEAEKLLYALERISYSPDYKTEHLFRKVPMSVGALQTTTDIELKQRKVQASPKTIEAVTKEVRDTILHINTVFYALEMRVAVARAQVKYDAKIRSIINKFPIPGNLSEKDLRKVAQLTREKDSLKQTAEDLDGFLKDNLDAKAASAPSVNLQRLAKIAENAKKIIEPIKEKGFLQSFIAAIKAFFNSETYHEAAIRTITSSAANLVEDSEFLTGYKQHKSSSPALQKPQASFPKHAKHPDSGSMINSAPQGKGPDAERHRPSKNKP